MKDAETIQRLLLQDTLQKEELGKRDAELAKTLDRTDDMRKKRCCQRNLTDRTSPHNFCEWPTKICSNTLKLRPKSSAWQ
jgi:hypothetical protein